MNIGDKVKIVIPMSEQRTSAWTNPVAKFNGMTARIYTKVQYAGREPYYELAGVVGKNGVHYVFLHHWLRPL